MIPGPQDNRQDRSLIIIITYNSSDFIEDCLKSVAGQTYKNWKLIVADNDSGDDTVKKIRDFRNQAISFNKDNFKFVHLKKNIGFAGAVNHIVFGKGRAAINREDYQYLILLNPDICLFPDALDNLTAALGSGGAGSAIGACGGLILEYDKDIVQHTGGKAAMNLITSHEGAGRQYSGPGSGTGASGLPQKAPKRSNIIKADYVTGAFFATVLSLFYDVGGFDRGYRPMYYEELDYCLKIKEARWQVVSEMAAICRHYEGASVNKFSRKFYCYYHKNRIRCAVINMDIKELLIKFIPAELRWLRKDATGEQAAPLVYAYFMNMVFLVYNLAIRIKNYFILNKIELK